MQRISCVLSSKDSTFAQPQMYYSITDEQKEALERQLDVNQQKIDELKTSVAEIRDGYIQMGRGFDRIQMGFDQIHEDFVVLGNKMDALAEDMKRFERRMFGLPESSSEEEEEYVISEEEWKSWTEGLSVF